MSFNDSNSDKSSETNSKNPATIGSSVSIKGEITGEEDVIIHGYVEGLINLKKNVVKVAKSGRVQAHIYGQVIHVDGEITGNLFGTEQIIVHASGNVKGNLTAPRISIEDGARVKGAIDTDAKPETTLILKEGEILKGEKIGPVEPEALPSNGKRTSANAALV